MSVILAALLLAGQQATPVETTAPAVHKKKPQQVCEMVEITGSRAKKRVCRDTEGNLDLGPGVSSSFGGKGSSTQPMQSGTPGSR